MGTRISEERLYKRMDQMMVRINQLEKELTDQKEFYENKIAAQEKIIIGLTEKVEQLTKENQKLKEMLNKDSSNSSKPPSSNGFKEIKNQREKTGKKCGGQKGHKGSHLEMYENPTEIIEHKKEKCECGCKICYKKNKYKSKQKVDIAISVTIEEHRAYEGYCPECEKIITNEMPIELVNEVTYGENLKSFTAILNNDGMVSINRTRQIIDEITDGKVTLSEGTIVNFNKELSRKLEPVIEEIKDQLIISPVNHKDETSVKVDGKINWLHVLSNNEHTIYYVNAKRGHVADDEVGLLPLYGGILVHDHLKGLYHYQCDHAECNAHILRYLKGIVENEKLNWASEMIEFLVSTHNRIKELRADSIGEFSSGEVHQYFDRYDEIIANGEKEFPQTHENGKAYNSDGMRLLRRMKEYKEPHLRFISDFNVPFDNNLAERDLRMIKAKTKISGSFRGDNSGQHFANIRSYISTLRKNSLNILQGTRAAFLGNAKLPENIGV